MNELPIPPAAKSARQAIELARVWAADGAQHVCLQTGVWADPAAWGLMLVDLARHVARAYEQTGTCSREDALARIRAAFDAEWAHPTDDPVGNRQG
ncbi:MAG: DUF5076 domain-containing protein [Planctomycetes bacterium]|nr:DUF5076 domain-containing protein [Planctomycetota bacterium]